MNNIDFTVTDHGSIAILRPLTDEAREWCDENVSPDVPMWAGGYSVNYNALDRALDQIINDGLTVGFH